MRGTRQHCRDNVTLFSGQTIVAYCFLAIFVGGTPVGQRGIIIYRIFFVAEAVTCCCALVVASQKIGTWPALYNYFKVLLHKSEGVINNVQLDMFPKIQRM